MGHATTMASAFSRHGVAHDLGAQAADDGSARDRERGATALGLEIPVDGLATDGGDQLVHFHRIFGAVETGDLGGPHQQAAVVAGHGLFEFLRDLGGDLIATCASSSTTLSTRGRLPMVVCNTFSTWALVVGLCAIS
jgi:hypothetical protein